MSKITLSVETTIRDKHGKIIKQTRKPCKSFVKQFLQALEATIAHTAGVGSDAVTMKDVTAADRSVIGDTIQVNAWWPAEAGATDDVYGIIVGTGTTAVTITDYTIETKTAHGNGAGELEYGATSIAPAYVDGSSMKMNIVRAFVNNSGGTITIKEVAIQNKINPYTYLMVRDAVNDEILDGQSYTVTFTFTTSV